MSSLLSKQAQAVLETLKGFLKDRFTIDTNDIDQVVEILAKVDYAGASDDFWLKDGLVFAHNE